MFAANELELRAIVRDLGMTLKVCFSCETHCVVLAWLLQTIILNWSETMLASKDFMGS